MARPQWQEPVFETNLVGHGDPRLINAPLQQLSLCPIDRKPLEVIRQADFPWLVLTSPASVQALAQWMAATQIDLMRIPGLRIAAVGAGTRNGLAEMSLRQAGGENPGPLNLQTVITSAASDKANAHALLQALDGVQQQEHFDWKDQTILIVQGQDNRPTLHDGFLDRQARVTVLNAYRRQDVEWPSLIWTDIAASDTGEVGVVVTSTTVVDRLLKAFHDHRINPIKVVWCTQHAAIAEKLQQQGIAQVRYVQLDQDHLIHDLFEHEQYW